MNRALLRHKAERLRELHEDPRLLVLPNIWDPLGARLLERSGFPAAATASAAVAWSLGQPDGQRIGLETMLATIRRIAAAVTIPVTADLESGYADTPDEVAEHALHVLEAGAVGINLEDSLDEGAHLFPVARQCDRIRAVRTIADREGVPLFVNARIDVFLADGSDAARIEAAVERGRAYLEAGADCLYPIPVGDVPTLTTLREACGGAHLNAYARAGTAPMRELERAGISRLSLGPGLLKASLTAMRDVVETLRDYGPYDRFTTDAMSSEEAESYIRR